MGRRERPRKQEPHQGRSGHEAEPEYCQLLKDWKPDMSKEELVDGIRQFHDAVSDVQARDRESRENVSRPA